MKVSIVHLLFSGFLLLGFSASSLLGLDITITKLTFLPPVSDTAIPIHDVVAGTYSPIQIAPPHWKSSDNKHFPAVYVRNQKLRVKLKLEFSEVPTSSVILSGRSPLVSFSPVKLTSTGDRYAEVLLQSDGSLPNRIGQFDTEFSWNAKLSGDQVSEICKTKATFLVTLKKPIVKTGLYRELIEFSCIHAAGLSDEKEICDVLMKNLHKTGLHYGRNGWSTLQILQNRGGMCGGWCRVFQDLCGTQGIDLGAWFFTLRRERNENNEVRWHAIDILDPGLNNTEPTFTAAAALVNEVYPMPAYFSQDSTEDDVDYDSEKAIYRFATVQDGHCINFLKYKGKQYMYDPSFGKGPFTGFFAGDIPANKDMTIASLKTFRKVYFDNGVDHLLGRLLCKDANNEVEGKYLSPLTTLIPNEEIKVYWQDLDGPPIKKQMNFDQDSSRRAAIFSKLFSVIRTKKPSTEPAIDYLASLRNIEKIGKGHFSRNDYRNLLLRSEPIKVIEGRQLPGLLPPLQMLQRALVMRLEELKDNSLNREVKILKHSAGGTFRKLLENTK